MKTETQIAQENIQELIRTSKYEDLQATVLYWKGICYFHRETCERFLKFLEEHEKNDYRGCGFVFRIREKTTDLQQAIKLYDEAGI